MNLTPWFNVTQMPVRPGVYMVDQSRADQEPQGVFAFFDGRNWYPQGSTPKDAMYTMCYGIKKGPPFKQWRGIQK